MKKYIIKNCPSCRPYNVFGLEDSGCCYSQMTYCKQVSDCLLKKIVEKTKKYINDETDFSPEELLSMLEIEECE